MMWQVLWLEEYLMRWKKTLVVVSHDRDFLNSVTTDIIHLHDLGLHFYRCASRQLACLAEVFLRQPACISMFSQAHKHYQLTITSSVRYSMAIYTSLAEVTHRRQSGSHTRLQVTAL